MPYKDKAKFAEYMRKRRASLKFENQMWSNIRIWYPPFAKDGAYYRTQFVSNIAEVKDGQLFGVVTMKLIPEGVKTK
jgi:hypothetical protein